MAELLITCANSNLTVEQLIKLMIRDADCLPYVNCDNANESLNSLIRGLFSVLADGTLALNICACEGGL